MDYDEIERTWAIPRAGQMPGLDQVYAYLKKRGITPKYAGELGLHIVPAAQLLDAAMGTRAGVVPTARENRLAIVFPHRPHSQWWSARLVDVDHIPKTERHGWEKLVEGTKRAKMFAPPGRVPDCYLVPTLDWNKLHKGDRVFIHESCIKAANGARLGYWSIGLNGVWGWSTKKNTTTGMVASLLKLPWKRLELVPVIVFDSNWEDNWDVRSAAEKLAEKLMLMTGRRAEIMHVPMRDDKTHRGFDDFCVEAGDVVAADWLDKGGEVAELDPVRLGVIQLNEEVCIVESLSRVADIAEGNLMSRAEFCDVNYADRTVYDTHTEKVVSVPRAWMASPWRTKVKALAYAPGQGKITEDRELNLWKGWGVTPKKGDVQPWLRVLNDSISDPAMRTWVIKWLAYPLQVPGAKMNTALLMFGPPGTGKDAILWPIKRIYGESNAVEISNNQLKGSFNHGYSAKQFIQANELVASYDSQDLVNQVLKMLITSEFMYVNRKGQPEYTIRNCANLAITSNYVNCVKLDEDDRRLTVLAWANANRGPGSEDYWKKYWKWAEEGDGAEALFDYLVGVDLTGWNPKQWAPMTQAKEDVVASTRSPAEEWILRLLEDPDKALGMAHVGKSLFTSEELAFIFNSSHAGKPISPVRMGVALHHMGVGKTPRMRWQGRDGVNESFWIIRNRRDDWTTPAAVRRARGAKG